MNVEPKDRVHHVNENTASMNSKEDKTPLTVVQYDNPLLLIVREGWSNWGGTFFILVISLFSSLIGDDSCKSWAPP